MFDISIDRLMLASMRDAQCQIDQERPGTDPLLSIPQVGYPGMILQDALDFLDDLRIAQRVDHPVALLWDLATEFSLTPWDAVCICAFWIETWAALHPAQVPAPVDELADHLGDQCAPGCFYCGCFEDDGQPSDPQVVFAIRDDDPGDCAQE